MGTLSVSHRRPLQQVVAVHVPAFPVHDVPLPLFTVRPPDSPLQSNGVVAHVAGASQQVDAVHVPAFPLHDTPLPLFTVLVLRGSQNE